MKSITVRERKGKRGVTLVLDIYEDGKRLFETLKDEQGNTLKIYENPKTTEERNHNKMVRQYAQTIKAKREAELLTGNYSVKAKSNYDKADFYAFIDLVAEKKNNFRSYHRVRIFLKKRKPTLTFKEANSVEFLEQCKSWLLKDIKKGTAKLYFQLLMHVLKIAHQKGLIQHLNTAKIEPIKSPQKVLKYLELEELKQLFSTPIPIKSKYDVKTICLFAFYTLLRISDIYTLKWGNIVKRGDTWVIEKKIVKTKSNKVIALNDNAIALLPTRGKDDDYVFYMKQPEGEIDNYTHTRLFAVYLDRILKKWAKAAGLNKIVTTHVFRHSGATAMVTAGVDIYTISKQLTHSSVVTTQIYANVVLEKQQEGVNKLPKIL
jgi:integrase